MPSVVEGESGGFDPDAFAAVAPLAQTRVALLSEIVPNVGLTGSPTVLAPQPARWGK